MSQSEGLRLRGEEAEAGLGRTRVDFVGHETKDNNGARPGEEDERREEGVVPRVEEGAGHLGGGK